MPVQIVYDDDGSCGRLPHKPFEGYNGTNNSMNQMQTPPKQEKSHTQNSSNHLKTSTTGRLEIDPDAIKKTRKSKSKQQTLVDSMANKKFEITRDKCVRMGKLFEDADFPADASSIGNVTGLDLSKIEWLRPKEIDPNADYVQDNIDRFDINQGRLGNCWLLAVLSSITNYPKLLEHVIPQNQSMKTSNYAGIFRFRFWQFGKWQDVIIDDRIPVFKGTKQLVFMHSSDPGEFWSPLVEKAYAKLNGSYANLEGGVQAEAMEDFTGGMCETIDLKQPPQSLRQDMYTYTTTCTMMGVSTISQSGGEESQNSGLVRGHAYSVTGVDYVTYQGTQQWLVRCRNPWGNSIEWKGPFSDNAPEWNSVSQQDKERLDVKFEGDGEFWMTWEDFLDQWTTLEICHLSGSSLVPGEETQGKKKLEESIFAGEWTKNVSAGGCLNNRDTFHMNPQFKIVVPEGDDSSFVSIGLMQKDMRAINDGKYLSIGFMVYKLSNNDSGLLRRSFFATTKHTSMSKFAASREVVARIDLKPGNYAIIPSTFDKNQECTFILRVMTMVPVENTTLDNVTRPVGLPAEIRKELDELGAADDASVKAHFNRLQDREELINSANLIEILNSSALKSVKKFKGFTLEMGRTLLALVDDDISGHLTWKEFELLWEDCQVWKYIYEKVDDNHTGYLEPSELREAINLAGFNVSNQVFAAIVMRYTEPGTGYIDFDDYIICLSRLKNSIENMACQPKATTGQRIFSENEFMQYSIYT